MEKEEKMSIAEVEKIAELARIEITDDEKKEFASQLSDVLGYIAQLNEVDTENIEPVAQITGMVNVTRLDKSENLDEKARQEIIKNFPEEEMEYVKVKQVL